MSALIEPEMLLAAYSQGYFPMAESRDGDIYWHSPDPRAIFNIYEIEPPRSIRQIIRKGNFIITENRQFPEVIKACSVREDTWISDEIIESYINLHNEGYAQSVETWFNGELAGGLYGVTIGGAFFGESMFSLVSNASKIAFYYLVEKLRRLGFVLLDTQYLNEHTQLLGAVEIPKALYLKILKEAVNLPVRFS